MSSRPTEFTATYFVSQIGQYVEHQTDNISKLVSVSSKLQLMTTSSTLQLSTNQLYSHFSGVTEPRPRQTVPIPCLFSDSHGMLEPRPRQTAPIQSISRFFGITEPRPRQTAPIPCLFPTSHGMPEPRPRQTAPIPISFTFLSSLQKLFSEPMHVCKPAHV